MKAQGEYLFLCDSHLSMPIEEVAKFLPPERGGYDVTIASREIEGGALLQRAGLLPSHGARLQHNRTPAGRARYSGLRLASSASDVRQPISHFHFKRSVDVGL